MVSTENIYEHLRTRLNEAGVKKVVLADNLFDSPTVSELSQELGDFLNLVGREDDLVTTLQEMGIGTVGVDEIVIDDIDNPAIEKLWNSRDDGTRISEFAKEKLFPIVLRDYESLLKIARSLEAIGLDVTKVGSGSDEAFGPAHLVFLDYYWGAVEDKNSPMKAGVVAKEIYDRHGDSQQKPFIVLMSSRAEVESLAEDFRNDFNLLGGLFDFVVREDLQDQHVLCVKLATWAAGMQTGHNIQAFVECLGDTISTKAQAFIKKVRSLTIQDYAYVQALRLQDDGQPLGDYMLWLFSSLLVSFVLEENLELSENKNMLDKLSFRSLIPGQTAPSNHLSEIYKLAIAEPAITDIAPHPRDDSPDEKKRLPLLRFGDLLVKDANSPLYMVATPDCDLPIAPGSTRKPERDMSVILIPGNLYPLNDSKAHSHIQTELFHYEDQQYRIYWEPKKVISVAIEQFRTWCSDNKYSRRARIRLPYALKIQHEFISDLGRIGMPVSPPVNERVDVQFYCEGSDGKWGPLGSPVNAGATVMHRGDQKAVVVFGTECLLQILRRMSSLVELYDDKREREGNTVKAQRYAEKIEKINSSKNNLKQLVALVEQRWSLPTIGKTTDLNSNVIRLHNGRNSGGSCTGHLICLGIEYDFN